MYLICLLLTLVAVTAFGQTDSRYVYASVRGDTIWYNINTTIIHFRGDFTNGSVNGFFPINEDQT
jgi:hypothetical protein